MKVCVEPGYMRRYGKFRMQIRGALDEGRFFTINIRWAASPKVQNGHLYDAGTGWTERKQAHRGYSCVTCKQQTEWQRTVGWRCSSHI